MDPVAHLTSAVEETAADLARERPPRGPKLDRPPQADFGDYSTNAAMLLAPTLGEAPRAIAEQLGERLGERLGETVERVEIAGPGFLNLFMADGWYLDTLAALLEAGERVRGGLAAAEHVNVEFVSANPTGPITVASARHAAYGDSLARILERAGHRVEREYYVNDAGSQVRRFGESIQARARGEEPPEDGYQGDYVRELAEQDRGRGRRRPGRARPARHRADARGRAQLARALPRADGPLLLRAHAARGRRDRGRARSASTTSTSTTARSGCAPPHTATTRTACCAARTASATYFASDIAYHAAQASSAATTARSTSGAPTTTATSPA